MICVDEQLSKVRGTISDRRNDFVKPLLAFQMNCSQSLKRMFGEIEINEDCLNFPNNVVIKFRNRSKR